MRRWLSDEPSCPAFSRKVLLQCSYWGDGYVFNGVAIPFAAKQADSGKRVLFCFLSVSESFNDAKGKALSISRRGSSKPQPCSINHVDIEKGFAIVKTEMTLDHDDALFQSRHGSVSDGEKLFVLGPDDETRLPQLCDVIFETSANDDGVLVGQLLSKSHYCREFEGGPVIDIDGRLVGVMGAVLFDDYYTGFDVLDLGDCSVEPNDLVLSDDLRRAHVQLLLEDEVKVTTSGFIPVKIDL